MQFITPDDDPSARLAAAGASVYRSTHVSSSEVDVSGVKVPVSTTHTMVSTWTLPKDTGLRARFGKETTARKLWKLFARELQTGDDTFDEAVFVWTKTADACTQLLSEPDVRAAILRHVENGGDVEIDGEEVTLRTRDSIEPVPPLPKDEAVVVLAVLDR